MQLSLTALLSIVAIVLSGLALLDLLRAATALSLAVMCLAVGLLALGSGRRL